MRLNLSDLPSDPALLHQLVRDMAAILQTRDGEIDRLQQIIRQLQRAQFGRRSERLDPDQLGLALEDLEGDVARVHESHNDRHPAGAGAPVRRRQALPDHLARKHLVLDIEGSGCPGCGGRLHAVGESVSEVLDWVPAELRALRISRPKYACRACGTVTQAPAPERVIAEGCRPQPCWHRFWSASTAITRRSTDRRRSLLATVSPSLAGWIGGACWWLDALHERLAKDVFASGHLFADDTPIPVLDPGRGRTKMGRLWVYARDQRPWAGPAPPAAIYFYEPDRRGERPATHLAKFKGVLHVDGYAGFERLTARGNVVLAACWAHARRKFYEIALADNAPIAIEAVRRIGDLSHPPKQIEPRRPRSRQPRSPAFTGFWARRSSS